MVEFCKALLEFLASGMLWTCAAFLQTVVHDAPRPGAS